MMKERKTGILKVKYSDDPTTRLLWNWDGGNKFGFKNIWYLTKIWQFLNVGTLSHMGIR